MNECYQGQSHDSGPRYSLLNTPTATHLVVHSNTAHMLVCCRPEWAHSTGLKLAGFIITTL